MLIFPELFLVLLVYVNTLTHFSAFILKCYCCRWFVFLPPICVSTFPVWIVFICAHFTISQHRVLFSLLLLLLLLWLLLLMLLFSASLHWLVLMNVQCDAMFTLLFSCPSLLYDIWMNMMLFFCANISNK